MQYAALVTLRKRMQDSMKELVDIEMHLRDDGMKKSGYIVGDATIQLDKAMSLVNRAIMKKIDDNEHTG